MRRTGGRSGSVHITGMTPVSIRQEEEAQQLAKMEVADMGGGEDNIDLYEEEEAAVQEICKRKRTMRNVGRKK